MTQGPENLLDLIPDVDLDQSSGDSGLVGYGAQCSLSPLQTPVSKVDRGPHPALL